MGKLKEEFAEIVEHFAWKRFIIGLCLAFALGVFILGVVLYITHENLAWLTLLVISIIAVAVAIGVEG